MFWLKKVVSAIIGRLVYKKLFDLTVGINHPSSDAFAISYIGINHKITPMVHFVLAMWDCEYEKHVWWDKCCEIEPDLLSF